MTGVNKVNSEDIKIIFKNNFAKLNEQFVIHQSAFMAGVYKRYFNDLEMGNIVLCFAKTLHLSILRQREDNLHQDISFDNFWNNHNKCLHHKFKIIDVSNCSGLPKETTRRKIKELIKLKVLKKRDEKIIWDPLEPDRQSYNIIIKKNINSLSRLTKFFLDFVGTPKSLIEIEKEIKDNYSFYWYHYLNTQQSYFRLWQGHLKDLELLLISLECSIQGAQIFSNSNLNFEEIFSKKIKYNKDSVISSTTISQITGIPRATCIRKMEKLMKLKLIKKDSELKKYLFDYRNYGNSLINSKVNNGKLIDLFSDFFFIIIRAFGSSKN